MIHGKKRGGSPLNTITKRFLKPEKLGVASASPLRHDTCEFEWTAATCRYLTGSFFSGKVPLTCDWIDRLGPPEFPAIEPFGDDCGMSAMVLSIKYSTDERKRIWLLS